MRVSIVALILLCLISVAWVDTTQGQVLGPFCVQVGSPLNATFNLLVPVVTPTQFQIVGTVFGEVPVSGSGSLDASNHSRFSVIVGGTIAPPNTPVPPISLTGTLDLGNLAAPGSGVCFGGAACGVGVIVTVQLVEEC